MDLRERKHCGLTIMLDKSGWRFEMERLTVKSDLTGLPMPKALQESCSEDSCENVCEIYVESGCVDCPVQKCMTKLSAYEDTGFEPEDIISNTTVQFDIREEGFLNAINTVFKQKLGVMLDDIPKIISKYQEYKDLEEQDLLIKLPCKVGDTVYCINDTGTKKKPNYVIEEYIVDNYMMGEHLGIIICSKETGWMEEGDIEIIGKTVFLTKEEAEQVLKGAEDEN